MKEKKTRKRVAQTFKCTAHERPLTSGSCTVCHSKYVPKHVELHFILFPHYRKTEHIVKVFESILFVIYIYIEREGLAT